MEIRIGVTNTPRELTFEYEGSADSVAQLVASAFDEQAPFIRIHDAKENLYLIPTATLAYIEIGAEKSRRIGFVG